MSNQTVIELEQVIAMLLPYTAHKYSCESLEPMWHKGPCDCGFAAIVVQLRSVGINVIDGSIYMGSPQPPLCKTCVKCGQPIPEPMLDGFEGERCRDCADPEMPCSTALADELRCRYSDCAEQHPVAGDDERVTCPSCREWMGLPTCEEADQ